MKNVFTSMAWLVASTLGLAQGQQPPAPVVVTPVIEREVHAGQTFVATVLPSKRAIVGSAVEGRVVEFPLNEGQPVAKGQVLAKLLTETIALQMEAEKAELEIRRQQLAELVNGARPEELRQAKARMLAAEARKTYLAARRLRAESLFDRGRAMSKEELDAAVSEAVAAEQDYIDLKVAYELAMLGPRKERIAQARAQVDKQLAVVNQLKDQINRHTIVSHFDGYITAELTEVGQWVKQGDPVAEIAALDVVEILAYVIEKHVPHIVVGTEVRFEIPAIPNRLFTGRIAFVVPQGDLRARTFPVKIRARNQIAANEPLLRSGMSARVIFPTGAAQLALLVHKNALVPGATEPLVYVVDRTSPRSNRGKAEPLPVVLGVASGDFIQVSGSVKAGQMVIAEGHERLKPGQDVVVVRRVDPKPVAAATRLSRARQQ